MNTLTLSETTAVVEAEASAPAATELRRIPLSQLKPSNRNVRGGNGTSIPELAASIARVGLLHNLVVVPAADGVHFEVVAGRRRLDALKLLVKRRKITKAFEVLCLIVASDTARTASLTENIQREAMHPADQFEAFAALVKEGRPIEDIAADFGVTPLVVQRRLRLANVSPRLLDDYRAGTVTLEQLMALAVTDDHASQESAFYDALDWQRNPDDLRMRLTQGEIDAGRDALAKFVSVEAYEAAGGPLRRDLFADEHRGVYLGDPALLERLAREKLDLNAEQVRGEGWLWVDVVPRVTHAQLHLFQRARRERRKPTKAEAKRSAALETEQQSLQDQLEDENGELPDEEAQRIDARLDELGSELNAIEESLTIFSDRVIAKSGAIVTVDHVGALAIHRGLLRPTPNAKAADATKDSSKDRDESDEAAAETPEPKGAGLSEKLVRRLSAQRTAALQAEVACNPKVALVALVHRLAGRVICDDYGGSPIGITATSYVDGLVTHAPDIDESPAATGLRSVRQAWAARLPSESDALFAELLAMPQDELLSLLAVCVASTVLAMASKESERPAELIAGALGLDMHRWWTPTSAGYFEHVSKAKALEAVQVFAPDQVTRLGKLKKVELASEAERLAAGTGWLPTMLDKAVAAA